MTEVIQVPLADLKPYPNNPRTHSDEQIAQLVASIQEFGFTAPVLINSKRTILAGHGRTEAAALAGHESAPCIVLKGLTKDQERAYVIADNKLTILGDWDMDLLKAEMRKLEESTFDIEITGFSEYEIKRLLDDGTDGNDDSEKGKGDGYTIGYQLVFDDESQQDTWYSFMREVRESFSGETFAESLTEWIKHHQSEQ